MINTEILYQAGKRELSKRAMQDIQMLLTQWDVTRSLSVTDFSPSRPEQRMEDDTYAIPH